MPLTVVTKGLSTFFLLLSIILHLRVINPEMIQDTWLAWNAAVLKYYREFIFASDAQISKIRASHQKQSVIFSPHIQISGNLTFTLLSAIFIWLSRRKKPSRLEQCNLKHVRRALHTLNTNVTEWCDIDRSLFYVAHSHCNTH